MKRLIALILLAGCSVTIKDPDDRPTLRTISTSLRYDGFDFDAKDGGEDEVTLFFTDLRSKKGYRLKAPAEEALTILNVLNVGECYENVLAQPVEGPCG